MVLLFFDYMLINNDTRMIGTDSGYGLRSVRNCAVGKRIETWLYVYDTNMRGQLGSVARKVPRDLLAKDGQALHDSNKRTRCKETARTQAL